MDPNELKWELRRSRIREQHPADAAAEVRTPYARWWPPEEEEAGTATVLDRYDPDDRIFDPPGSGPFMNDQTF